MIIKKLEVKGVGKETATVAFKSGLNVIAGPSDTGKSYITKCLQFILGAEQPPKPIEQAKGYTHLEVTFESQDRKNFILSRELKEDSEVTCTEIDNNNLTTVLKPTHKGSPNLSEFFLKQFGLGHKILAKGVESMNHSALTLRIFEKILLADETRIISESSPFGKGQNTEKTLEISLIKTLLTGEDDAAISNCRENKDSKEAIKRKIENLQDFLKQFFPENEDTNNLEELDSILEQLEEAYGNAEIELNDLIRSNNAIIVERDKLKAEANLVAQKFADDKVLHGRFAMLHDKYISDRERLEANSEAAIYIEQQRIANCPLCGNEIGQDSEVDFDALLQSNSAEIGKIDLHLADLISTQRDLQNSLSESEIKLGKLIKLISEKDLALGEKIGGKVDENRRLLKDLDNARNNFRKEREQQKKRKEIFEEIGRLQIGYDEISDTYKISDFSKEAYSLGEKISEILKRWDFPSGSNAIFDTESRDIVINGKPRSHFGKGYRAICFSSILLGLMEYLYPLGRHPGFVVLDSPLTTYRKRDENPDLDDEEVFLANNLIYAFYRDLCDYYKDKQIIVLDNQEPASDLYQSMHYIHFSKNESVGRYGFFPISKI